MALYLGENKVSPSLNTVIEKIIHINDNGESTTEITPIINYTTDDPDDLTTDREENYTTWIRPSNWPNLDAIDIPASFEGVYMTYKNTTDARPRMASFYCTMTGGTLYKIEAGHLDANNIFIADITNATAAHNTYVRMDYSSIDSTLYPYIVIRLTPLTTSAHFSRCCFGCLPASATGSIVDAYWYHNLCYERRGQLPYVNTVVLYSKNITNNYGYMTYYMEKDATIIGTAAPITGGNFASCWNPGINLRVIDVTGWNTSQWTITSLNELMHYCYTLETVDFSHFDTSKWAITTLKNAFAYCRVLRSTGIEAWDTSNWAVTDLSYAWDSCYKLLELNLLRWNTTNWRVTTFAYAWSNCFSLKKLKLSTWNTTNWRVTTFTYAWNGCHQLLETDLNSWNTSFWSVTNISYAWADNWKRRHLKDIEYWDTSNWGITTLAATWYNCISLTKLNLNSWNTSKWKVTTLASTWSTCRSLLELHISNWNVNGIDGDTTYTGWALTTLASTWTNCRKLKKVEAFNWHVTNAWAIKSLNSTFRYCYDLKEVDFSNWNTSAFNITDMAAFTSECYNLEKLIMTGITLNITTANNYGSTSSSGATTILYACYSLKLFDPPSNWNGRIYFSTTYLLPREEMIKFFLNLLPRDTDIGIAIGGQRYKLSADDITTYVPEHYTIS